MVDLQMAFRCRFIHFTSIFIFDGQWRTFLEVQKLGFIHIEVTLGTIEDFCVWNLIFLD